MSLTHVEIEIDDPISLKKAGYGEAATGLEQALLDRYVPNAEQEDELEKEMNDAHEKDEEQSNTRKRSSSSPRKANGPATSPAKSVSRQAMNSPPSSTSSQHLRRDPPASASLVSERRRSQDKSSGREQSEMDQRSSSVKVTRAHTEPVPANGSGSDGKSPPAQVKVESQSPVKSAGNAKDDIQDLGILYSVSEE